jgi:hypothetical protein
MHRQIRLQQLLGLLAPVILVQVERILKKKNQPKTLTRFNSRVVIISSGLIKKGLAVRVKDKSSTAMVNLQSLLKKMKAVDVLKSLVKMETDILSQDVGFLKLIKRKICGRHMRLVDL